MNKTEMIERLAEKTGHTKKDAGILLDTVLETIEETLVKGESVRLIGFGNFEVRERKARTGRNPQDPAGTIDIPASKAPVFKAGKTLKERVNG